MTQLPDHSEPTDVFPKSAVPSVLIPIDELPEVPQPEMCNTTSLSSTSQCNTVPIATNLELTPLQAPFSDNMDSLTSVASIAVMQQPIPTRAVQQLHDPLPVSRLRLGGEAPIIANCKTQPVTNIKTFQARVSTVADLKTVFVTAPPSICNDAFSVKLPMAPIIQDIQNAPPTGAQLATKLAEYFERNPPKGKVSVTAVSKSQVAPTSFPSTSVTTAAASVRGCPAATSVKNRTPLHCLVFHTRVPRVMPNETIFQVELLGSVAFLAVSKGCTGCQDLANRSIRLYVGQQIAHIVIDKRFNMRISNVFQGGVPIVCGSPAWMNMVAWSQTLCKMLLVLTK